MSICVHVADVAKIWIKAFFNENVSQTKISCRQVFFGRYPTFPGRWVFEKKKKFRSAPKLCHRDEVFLNRREGLSCSSFLPVAEYNLLAVRDSPDLGCRHFGSRAAWGQPGSPGGSSTNVFSFSSLARSKSNLLDILGYLLLYFSYFCCGYTSSYNPG